MLRPNTSTVFTLFILKLFSFFSLITFSFADRVISSADIETLQLAQVLFRHGARSPIGSYDKDPYNNTKFWPDGLGQLTAKGKLMEYELGEYIRWRYTGFVNRTYTASEVYAQSSDIDRTIMSAELVLAGMFPPTEESPSSMWNPSIYWNPIPVHTISLATDNKISFAAKCPQYETLYYENLKTAYKIFDAHSEEMYKFLSEKTKTNITNIEGLNDLYDVLYIQDLHQLRLPDWAHRYYPEDLKPIAEQFWETLVPTDEMKRLRMGPLLGEMMTNMERTIRTKQEEQQQQEKAVKPSTPDAKIYLYSGHDSTVASLLGALRVFDRQIPPYSAAVFIELHQEKPTSVPGRHFVKVFFRNETQQVPYELKIPNCTEPCTLDNLRELLQDTIINDWDTWKSECDQFSVFSMSRAKEFFEVVDFWLVLAFAVIFSLGFIFAVILFLTVVLPRQRKQNVTIFQADGSSTCSSKISSRNSITNSNYKV